MQSAVHGTARGPNPKTVRSRELFEELAGGQLAIVQRARDTAEDGSVRNCVVKRVRPELASLPGWTELLADEALLLSSIDHLNVVACYDAASGANAHVVLQYIEGDSLEGLLRRSDVWRMPRLVAAVIADVLRGLGAVHSACTPDGVALGIVHQAPFARHILVGVDGVARLADFTQARVRSFDTGSYRMERLKGRPVAPELQEDPYHVDQRADLFALGVTLWESLTGEKLFPSLDSLRRRDAIRKPSSVGLAPSPAFDAVCLRALAYDPAGRYQSASEMLRALLAAAEQVGGISPAAELAHWVRATDTTAQPIARQNYVGATTLAGAAGAAAARAEQEKASTRTRKETLSWHGVAPPAESAPPAARRDQRGVTLLGLSASPLPTSRNVSSTPAPAVVEVQAQAEQPAQIVDAPSAESFEFIIEGQLASTNERPSVKDADRSEPSGRHATPPRREPSFSARPVSSPRASAPISEPQRSAAPQPSGHHGGSKRHLAVRTATLAVLAGVLVAGDLMIGRALPGPDVVLAESVDTASSMPTLPTFEAAPPVVSKDSARSAPVSASGPKERAPAVATPTPAPTRPRAEPVQAPRPRAERTASPSAAAPNASPTAPQELLPENPY